MSIYHLSGLNPYFIVCSCNNGVETCTHFSFASGTMSSFVSRGRWKITGRWRGFKSWFRGVLFGRLRKNTGASRTQKHPMVNFTWHLLRQLQGKFWVITSVYGHCLPPPRRYHTKQMPNKTHWHDTAANFSNMWCSMAMPPLMKSGLQPWWEVHVQDFFLPWVLCVHPRDGGCPIYLLFFVLFFKRFFWCGPFLKSLLNLLQYCFCFMFCFLAMRHVRS